MDYINNSQKEILKKEILMAYISNNRLLKKEIKITI